MRDAVDEALGLLDHGAVRVAERRNGIWHVNQWLKKAVLLSFRLAEMSILPFSGEAGARAWTFFASVGETSSAAQGAQEAKTARRATRTITNADIDQENQKTGTVKYDGKTEKLQ